MSRRIILISLLIAFVFSCHKKNKDDNSNSSPPPVVVPNVPLFPCENIPPPPQPFGWADSTTNEEENLLAFMQNPVNSSEIICLAQGNIGGYNQLFTYDVVNKVRTPLANLGNFLPSISQNGWIIYGSFDNDIIKIKTNGDSATTIMNTKTTLNPQFDGSGNSLFYFQQAYFSIISSVIKTTLTGPPNGNLFPADLPYYAPFHNSDEVIYFKPAGTEVTMVRKNLKTQAEQYLVTGPFDPKGEKFYFEDLCLDRGDKNVFWTNSSGISMMNLSTLKVDTILKNCPNYTYDNPLITFNPDELTCSLHLVKPIGSTVLLHQYKTLQYNLLTKKLSEVRIFP